MNTKNGTMTVAEYVLRVNKIIRAGYAESVVAARSREMFNDTKGGGR